jgi:hypothetical protein
VGFADDEVQRGNKADQHRASSSKKAECLTGFKKQVKISPLCC